MVLHDLLRNYDFSNPHIVQVLLVSAVAFGFGYGVYIYCILLLVRERKSPYPVWMHTFYLACDVTGTVFWFLLAKQHGWFWFFTASSAAMAIWVFCELWSLYMVVTYERQDTWGHLYQQPVTTRQAVNQIVAQTAWFFGVINLTNYFMGGLDDAAMFKWYVWTNLIVAVGPASLWAARKSRHGTSMGLAIMVLLSIIATYLPPGLGMWTTASSYFNNIWFYLSGLVATGYAIYNLWLVKSFPAKPAVLDGRKTVW
ncbi:hypothetical protein MycrhDRAFT_3288 [Mycolicibacterium rhodesiae JS60]|nr:hypothetical protein MycrhDRAFT_3288 [Mycolicibacterium rhodesiae JS60]